MYHDMIREGMAADDPIEALIAAGRHAEAAAALEAKGDLARARALYERIWAFPAAARCAEKQGDLGAAMLAWIDARRPEEARRVARGLEGIEGARRAAEIWEQKRAWGDAGSARARLGEHEAAAAHFQKAGLLGAAARELVALDRKQEAGRLLERHLERAEDAEDRRETHFQLGQLLAGLGSHEDAVRHLQEATRGGDAPFLGDALVLMARQLAAQGLDSAAESALARARAVDPRAPLRLRELAAPHDAPRLPGASAPPRVGGRYRLLELIGQGAAGRVYRALDEVSGVAVAVKMFTAAQARGHAAYDRFVREAEIWRRGRHPNIVDVLDFREDEGFLVMELMAGTLTPRLTPRLPPRDVRRLAVDLLSALAHAHARGVVHRDVKPANVFFDAAGTAKLGDFGAAHLADLGQTQTGALIGTLAYMSPEQVTGAPIGHGADLYALGVTLFQALTGRLPFLGPDFVAQHLGEPAPLASDVWAPAGLEWDTVLDALLQKDAARRPSSADAALEAVRAIGSGKRLEVLVLPRGALIADPLPAVPEPAAVTPPPPSARYQGEVVLAESETSTLVRAVDRALERSVVLERFHGDPPAAIADRLAAAARGGGSTLQRVLSLTPAQVVYEAPAGDPVGTRPLAPRQAAQLLHDLGAALESLHAAGVVHGAVTADRVLWDDRATLALAGLGATDATAADDARAALLVVAAALPEPGADLWERLPEAAPLRREPARGADLVVLARELRVVLSRRSG
jgi:eukaryotic-like serine/threonine-protein kinase